ncbi:MAG: hypothetical protein EKK34_19920 [Mycobacterium sp.]|nr:MAG: hypothetical protein EKK34_19920 [Mycobacterium sp.]
MLETVGFDRLDDLIDSAVPAQIRSTAPMVLPLRGPAGHGSPIEQGLRRARCATGVVRRRRRTSPLPVLPARLNRETTARSQARVHPE